MKGLGGKRFVISGASSGIGLETARLLASEGGEVCVVSRSEERARAAAGTLGSAAWGRACDVSRAADVQQLAAAVESRWGHLDGLVNCAGIAPMARLDETGDRIWDETFAVNVRGPFLTCRELGPLLHRGQGPAVVNVSSNLAEKAIPGMAAYNASKAALNHLSRSLALEWAPVVRVNAVMPGVIDTPIHVSRGMTPEQVEAMGEIHPLGRIGRPEEVASLIAFLLSEEAAWITGAAVPIDGGMLAT